MNRIERQARIFERLKEATEVTVADLCQTFNISEMTVRRDLADMDGAGLVRRVHGGAVLSDGRSYEPPFSLRITRDQMVKDALASHALDFVHDGDNIALDVGTTVLALAALLARRRGLTILTASLPVAQKVIEQGSLGRGHQLILTGGVTRPGELSMIGDLAQRTYREYHVDKAFVGIGGISLQDGLTEYNVEDAMVKRELLKSANEVYLLAHGTKFGRTTFATVGDLEDVNVFITDQNAPEPMIEQLRLRGHTVQVVEQ